MIERLVLSALKTPFVVFLLAASILLAGAWSYKELDIEAYPNPVPPLVEVIAQPDGMSAEDVERYVTVPLEIGLAGMPGLEHTRSQSLFGLADVKCYFRWGTTYEAARQEVLNRLAMTQLPDGVSAQISPWNAIGEVFRYELKGKGYSLRDLKTAEDWILERQFKQVPGVIDVVSFGGETKQYHVNVDPFRLRGYGLTLDQLINAVQSSNQNVGGQRLTLGEQAYTIRGVGLVRDVHDIEAIVIAAKGGVPIRVRDVATVDLGHTPRLGIVGHDESADVVQGTILMRYGGETPTTLKGIHERIEYIRANHLLPPGMDIAPYYDRGSLVALTTHTVIENVVVAMVLVTIILVLFLGHVRAALITALNVPLALLLAFCGMVFTGTPANLISIGAVDFGIVVDSSVIMMESVFHFLGKHGSGSIEDRILAGGKVVARPMTFSTIIIGVAFLPLFTMTGVSGVIFSPMAHTYAFAIGGAILLALTLTPALTAKIVPANTEETDSFVTRGAKRLYWPIFRLGVERPWLALVIGLAPVIVGLALFKTLGGEFMPKLEEGNLWIRASLPTGVSLEHSAKYVGRMRSILRGCPADGECTDADRKHPEVLTVVSQLGRPDDGTDVAGFQNIELFAPLKPAGEWKKGYTKAMLTSELSKELEEAFPGVTFNFSQMISDNVEEAMSGVKGENSIKVFGPDVKQNEKLGDKIMTILGEVKGVEDLGLVRSTGQPSVKIIPDRQACSRFGLNSGNVEAVISAAIGGRAVTSVMEGDRRFDLTVRWLPPYRESVEAIRELMIFGADGTPVPLGEIASITMEDSPAVVFREDGTRYTPIKFSVRGRDLESTVSEAQHRVATEVSLGQGIHLEWSGEINQLREAQVRLAVIIPATLVLIALLVYGSMRNFWNTLIVLLNVPVACAGGVLGLFLTQLDFSVSAAMGFISIFGIAIQDAILVVSHFQRVRERTPRVNPREAALDASSKRLRPALMTSLVALFGLLPAALSHGIGSETQKPLAVVVIGGALVLAVVARFVQAPLLILVHEWLERRQARRSPAPIANAIALLVAVSVCLFGRTASAQKSAEENVGLSARHVTLDNAVEMARTRGFDVLLASSQVKSAEADVRSASALPNPLVNGNLGWTLSCGGPCTGGTPWGWGVGLADQGLIEGALSNKRGLRRNVAERALAAAKYGRADAERVLVAQTKIQYVQTAAAATKVDFIREVAASLAKSVEVNRVRYPRVIDEGQLFRVEQEALKADQDVERAVRDLRGEEIQLAYLLGFGGARAIPQLDVDKSAIEFRMPEALGSANKEALYRAAVDNRPDRRQAVARENQSAAQIALSRRLRFPDISLNAQYAEQGSGAYTSQLPTFTVGLALPLPLLYRQEGEIRRAEADREGAAISLQKIDATLSSDIETAWSAFVAAKAIVRRYEDNLLDRARKARDITQVQYIAGSATLTDLLDAQRSYVQVNVDYEAELVDYWTAVFQIEQAVGKEFVQ